MKEILDPDSIFHPLMPLFTWKKAEHAALSVACDLDKVNPFIQELFSLLSSMEQLYGDQPCVGLGDSVKNWQSGLTRPCTGC